MGFKDEMALYDAVPQPYSEIFAMRADGSDVRQLTDNKWRTPAQSVALTSSVIVHPEAWLSNPTDIEEDRPMRSVPHLLDSSSRPRSCWRPSRSAGRSRRAVW